MTALACINPTTSREAKAALLVPIVTPVVDPLDVFGSSFMIAASLTVTQTQALNFGTVAAPGSGIGNLAINPNGGARTYDTANSAIAADAFSFAIFTVTGGQGTKTYTVTLPASATVGGCTVTFSQWSAGGDVFSGGNDSFNVGGNVAIPAAATAGNYTLANAGAVNVDQASGSRTGTDDLTAVHLKITKPLALTKTANPSFGDVVAGGTAGTVLLTTAGARTSTGGVTLGNGTGVSAGTFSLTGEPSTAYAVTVSPTTLSLTGPGTAMTVDTWVLSPTSPGVLPAVPPATLLVGGTLHVNANQTQGSYTGILTVSANYQ
ncbi:MAG: hypothetical protein JWM80_125 [Cyanobacteria bacterium RYN_339]|nr:hypothetical protein [Cyanobacteria bacterium RYN_339]